MVVAGIAGLPRKHSHLGNLWLRLVETTEIVVVRDLHSKRSRVAAKEVCDLENEIVTALAGLSKPSTAAMRGVRRLYSRRLASASPEIIIQLALRLTRSGMNHRFFAYELVQHHSQTLRSLNAGLLEELARGIDSWAAVDTFACYLAGPVWREGQVSDALIKRWAGSKDRWRRRAAVVSTVPLNIRARGGSGDVSRTLGICEMLIDDRDDMVVKAMSWALRALAVRDPKAVRRFLSEHQNHLASRVTREVNNKLVTGLKNPGSRKVSY